jgi:hypothetical protein
VPLTGQAACIAALGSAVLGCGAVGCGGLGNGVRTCAVCTVGGLAGRRRGASTVTAGSVGVSVCCCAGLAGDDDAPGCAGVAGGDADGASCAGVGGALGGVASGADVPGDDRGSSDCVAPCSAGGVACARTSLAPAAASAIELTERSASVLTAPMQ